MGDLQNRFRKSQIRKFADLTNLLALRTFHQCGTLRICDLRSEPLFVICGFVICEPNLFADLKLTQVRKDINFLLTSVAYTVQRRLLGLFVLGLFYRNLRIFDLRINHESLQICDLRTDTPKKFAIAE